MSGLKPGDRYTPDLGEHQGHVVEVVSFDGVRLNVMGTPMRSVLVRCHDCLLSWTFPLPEQDI